MVRVGSRRWRTGPATQSAHTGSFTCAEVQIEPKNRAAAVEHFPSFCFVSVFLINILYQKGQETRK
jgi:hypothetical protein